MRVMLWCLGVKIWKGVGVKELSVVVRDVWDGCVVRACRRRWLERLIRERWQGGLLRMRVTGDGDRGLS